MSRFRCFVPFDLDAARVVINEIAPDEKEQLCALSGSFNASNILRDLDALDVHWVALNDECRPVMAGGLHFQQSWRAEAITISSALWDSAAHSITHDAKQVIAGIFSPEARICRLECYSLSTRTRAHAWYRMLGMQHEATLREYGAKGEDVALYAITHEDIHDVRRGKRRERAATTRGSTTVGDPVHS